MKQPRSPNRNSIASIRSAELKPWDQETRPSLCMLTRCHVGNRGATPPSLSARHQPVSADRPQRYGRRWTPSMKTNMHLFWLLVHPSVSQRFCWFRVLFSPRLWRKLQTGRLSFFLKRCRQMVLFGVTVGVCVPVNIHSSSVCLAHFMPKGGPIRGSWRRGEDYHAGSDCTPLASTEECGQINQRADQSVTHRVIPSASRSSASEALGQSSHAWLSISNRYSAQHSHVWNNLTWRTLTIKPLICVCVSGYSLLRQSHFTDLGKQFGIFIREERVPLVGGGSYVALYLASSYSCKCNLCNLNAGSWKEQSWEWNQRLRRKEEQTTFTFTQTNAATPHRLQPFQHLFSTCRAVWWRSSGATRVCRRCDESGSEFRDWE